MKVREGNNKQQWNVSRLRLFRLHIYSNCYSENLYRVRLRLLMDFRFGYPIDSVPFTELYNTPSEYTRYIDLSRSICRQCFTFVYLIVDKVMLTTFIVRI